MLYKVTLGPSANEMLPRLQKIFIYDTVYYFYMQLHHIMVYYRTPYIGEKMWLSHLMRINEMSALD